MLVKEVQRIVCDILPSRLVNNTVSLTLKHLKLNNGLIPFAGFLVCGIFLGYYTLWDHMVIRTRNQQER